MCRALKISRQTYYNIIKRVNNKKMVKQNIINSNVLRIHKANYGSYGSRTIQMQLRRENIRYGRQTIRKSMLIQEIESTYCKKKFKYYKSSVNRDLFPNEINQSFNNRQKHEVLTSDLTYVTVDSKHNYVCFIIDLYNREIVGYDVSSSKTPDIVVNSLNKCMINMNEVSIFHSDRGTEFKNSKINEIFKKHKIKQSLSKPGCPYDNAVSESTFKTFKQIWLKDKKYVDIIQLKNDVNEFVHWYNNFRIHSSLNYLSPVEYRYKHQ